MSRIKELSTELLNLYTTTEFIFDTNSEKTIITYVKDIDSLIDQIPPEEFDIDERLPYWADIWPSAYALAKYVENINCERKSVLELGSGVGLAGVSCGKLGAFVTFSDYEDEALKFCEFNALQNNLTKFSTKNIDWRNPELDQAFDIVIGADIVYEERQFIPVINMLKKFLNVGGKAYIAEPNRDIAFDFFNELKKHDYEYRKFKQHISFNGREHYVSICEIYQ